MTDDTTDNKPPANIEAEVDLLTKVFGSTRADGSFDPVLYAANRDALFRAPAPAPPVTSGNDAPPPSVDVGAELANALGVSREAYLIARAKLVAQQEAKRAGADPRHANHPRWNRKK